MADDNAPLVPIEQVAELIHVVRGQRVMLDSDLALLYDVPTGNVNRAVKRNPDRFPADFLLELTEEEHDRLLCQTGRAKQRGGRRSLPYAFTEQGVAMLSSVLRSERAAKVNVEIMRAFVRLRYAVAMNEDLARRLEAVEQTVGQQGQRLETVVDAIRQIIAQPPSPQRRIGFRDEG